MNKKLSKQRSEKVSVNADGTIAQHSIFSDAVAATGGPMHHKLHINLSHKNEKYVIILGLDNMYSTSTYSAYNKFSSYKKPEPMACNRLELIDDYTYHFTRKQVKAIRKAERDYGLEGKDTVIPVNKIKKRLKK